MLRREKGSRSLKILREKLAMTSRNNTFSWQHSAVLLTSCAPNLRLQSYSIYEIIEPTKQQLRFSQIHLQYDNILCILCIPRSLRLRLPCDPTTTWLFLFCSNWQQHVMVSGLSVMYIQVTTIANHLRNYDCKPSIIIHCNYWIH